MTKKILNHFKKNDPLLHTYALRVGQITLEKDHPDNYFYRLCRSISGQQLSGAAAETIFSRFTKLFPNGFNPKVILETPHEKIRSVGMSNSKVSYLKNLAQAVVDGSVDFEKIADLQNEEVILQLTKVKGIGPWTAEMFLMFTLGREDVFSYGDLGLKNGLKKIYGFKKNPSVKTIERIIKKWSPYKTYACRILWNSLEFTD